jgi:hypothetical protein
MKRKKEKRNIRWFHSFVLLWMLYSFFRWFPGVWIFCADVSEHSVCPIFIGRLIIHKKGHKIQDELRGEKQVSRQQKKQQRIKAVRRYIGLSIESQLAREKQINKH